MYPKTRRAVACCIVFAFVALLASASGGFRVLGSEAPTAHAAVAHDATKKVVHRACPQNLVSETKWCRIG